MVLFLLDPRIIFKVKDVVNVQEILRKILKNSLKNRLESTILNMTTQKFFTQTTEAQLQ